MINFLNKILIKFGYKIFSIKDYEDLLCYYNDINTFTQLECFDLLEKNKKEFYDKYL